MSVITSENEYSVQTAEKSTLTSIPVVVLGDLKFPRSCSYADYDSCWSTTFCDRNLINVTACWESTVMFSAREGWVNCHSPCCTKPSCSNKRNRSSYCSKRSDANGWAWRFRCCGRRQSILLNSIFYQGKLQPGILLEILWKISSRTPATMISRLVHGRLSSEVFARIQFFRDVVGWWEDFTLVRMGGPGKIVEGDGMFVIGKRKCGVGRWHSKEHIYACTERGSRKIRRILVPDKSADVSVFDDHILPNTTMCVDDGMENTHFKNLPTVTNLSTIPGPIHIDKTDPTKHTQTVESSHSGVKMRLRLGRGLHRHNLQPVMDLEDFIYNRTDNTPQDIFKKVCDIASIYSRTIDTVSGRQSIIPFVLRQDVIGNSVGLTLSLAEQLCSSSVFRKARRYEVKSNKHISTQCYTLRNTIAGEIRTARIHNQLITWTSENPVDNDYPPVPFNTKTFAATCTCRFYKKETKLSGKLCSHVIGQLRRVIFLQSITI